MYRKGVSVLIINNKNEFLLVNLKSFKEKYFAIPGGGIEAEETLEDAVYREIFEELGIAKDSLELIGKSDSPVRFKFKQIKLARDGKEYEGQERYFLGFRFIGGDNEIKPRVGEVRVYKWVTFDQLRNYLLFDNQLQETTEKIKEIFNIDENHVDAFLGQTVKIKIDRPLGSKHPKHDMIYKVNYGFVPDTKASDGEEIDAYLLGVDKPVDEFTGKCIAIVRRSDDDDDKLVIVPENSKNMSDEEILGFINFQEKWFKSKIIR